MTPLLSFSLIFIGVFLAGIVCGAKICEREIDIARSEGFLVGWARGRKEEREEAGL